MNCYTGVVAVMEEYLGPASKRFLERQVQFHMQKPATDLQPEDLPKLAHYVHTAMGLLTKDTATIEAATHKIEALATNTK